MTMMIIMMIVMVVVTIIIPLKEKVFAVRPLAFIYAVELVIISAYDPVVIDDVNYNYDEDSGGINSGDGIYCGSSNEWYHLPKFHWPLWQTYSD